ncbi:hypothetical protein C4D60_Mb09t05690 [Musa balbisiana]|uniref:Uncharacterized protein n=1 Tax=Musa balbisiana TaxID=52838 RepID=A0A4S8IE81_MUSBA|nr:hypothetical protein C4D60_Mb09t05690 [Musa balbisiana]
MKKRVFMSNGNDYPFYNEEKINEFLAYKRTAKSFRADLCNRKDSLGLASGKMFLTLMDIDKSD